MKAPEKLDRYFSSHLIDGRSRWLVGSSKSSRSGCCSNILASITRMRQSPETFLSGRSRSLLAKPSPSRISSALYRSEEHTSELPSLMRITYAVFCLEQNREHKTDHMK